MYLVTNILGSRLNKEIMDTGIQVTSAATGRIQELIALEGDESVRLRIYISGGGCAGFQYGFAFDKNDNEGDQLFPVDVSEREAKTAVAVVVDPLSYTYLGGATLDYEVGLRGAHFVVRNPNAQTTCGCGSSFSV